jgi:hypothetical protein
MKSINLDLCRPSLIHQRSPVRLENLAVNVA